MNEEEKEIIQRIQQDSTFRERSLLRIIEKQQTTINTMQAEFERLEDLEDNTDMLKMELEKKDKIIDFMATAISNYDSQLVINTYENKEHVKEVFEEYYKYKIEKGE